MKKIFLVLFLLVFCAYSQNDSDKNQSAKISGSMKAPSIEKAKKACENKEKNACITAVSMMLSEANSSADELKEAYKLTQIGCDISEDMSCVFYSQALLFGIFEDENINEGLKTLENSCQNGGAMSWLSQNLVREKSLKTHELGEVPDGVALDIIDFLTDTQEKLICDEPQSSECKSLLDEQCKGRENEEFCRSYMLTWNSSPRHESIAHDGARYFLDGMLNQYDKNKFIYFVKYAYNKRLPLNQLLSITAGYDDNGDELPLILALARNNATEPLQERIYGISGGELMELFRKYKISPKIAEIFTK
ncbi:hypothetical protein [Campylobacter sp.]|uniref:hypothetical protein n=1 Tax=Campylobacter sp. TaxID=205 RepID=UPI002A750672|nr:hypothetical protein [Campylobacter sp.]MDY3245601.1 hypothetical protein [Campylobacter sp.]